MGRDDPGSEAIELLIELQNLTERLSSGSARNLESLLLRRTEILQDLLYYRFYGFRAAYLEDLLRADPAIAELYIKISTEEEQYGALAEFQREDPRD